MTSRLQLKVFHCNLKLISFFLQNYPLVINNNSLKNFTWIGKRLLKINRSSQYLLFRKSLVLHFTCLEQIQKILPTFNISGDSYFFNFFRYQKLNFNTEIYRQENVLFYSNKFMLDLCEKKKRCIF